MVWKVKYSDGAKRELKKLDKLAARRILDYMDERVGRLEDPRVLGKALTGNLGTYWRYRVGDYRVLCSIEDAEVLVLVLKVAHRREVYE